jgi:Flp pilus assembly pilin Flp
MLDRAQRLLAEEEGQDLIEYSLLMCFIVIACMWFVGAGRDPVNGVWTSANHQVTSAQTAANGGG